MAACLPRHDHFRKNTKQLLRFHKNNFDEMLCKMNSSEYAQSFEPNPTLP